MMVLSQGTITSLSVQHMVYHWKQEICSRCTCTTSYKMTIHFYPLPTPLILCGACTCTLQFIFLLNFPP
jgi:hypothetical protein